MHHGQIDIAALSVMPDHRHAALRGALAASPQEIALTFQNNIAYALGQNAIWQPNTTSERERSAKSTWTPGLAVLWPARSTF